MESQRMHALIFYNPIQHWTLPPDIINSCYQGYLYFTPCCLNGLLACSMHGLYYRPLEFAWYILYTRTLGFGFIFTHTYTHTYIHTYIQLIVIYVIVNLIMKYVIFRFAIYIPLFLPVGVPVFLSLLSITRQLLQKRKHTKQD